MDSGDTAWMLAATALVMIMLPGLALFYGGLVRRKNVLSTIMHSFFGLAIVSVVWVLVGFSLAFAPDAKLFGVPGLIGGLDFVGFFNVGLEPSTLDANGKADDAFYEQVNVACYPPEADFVVHSQAHPESVVDYAEYVRMRDVYARTQPTFAEVRVWPPLAGV